MNAVNPIRNTSKVTSNTHRTNPKIMPSSRSVPDKPVLATSRATTKRSNAPRINTATKHRP